MKKNIEAFLYCWTDHNTNKLYVGVHKGNQHDGYICSSKTMLEQYNFHPKNFSRQIIAEGSYTDMLSLETSILKSVDAKTNDGFYNLHNGDGKFYNKSQTQEARQKISQSKIGKHHSEETKKKLSECRHSVETKEKLRQLRLNQVDPRLGKKHSSESIDKIRKAKIGNNCHTKKVTIDGILYNSYKDAAKALGCNYNTITKRVKRGIYV